MTNVAKLRSATVADIPLLIELERTSPEAAHWTEKQYGELFRAPNEAPERLVVVAEGARRPATEGSSASLCGFLVARHLAPEWELENIVVAPSARRQGIGRQLLDAWLARARETHSSAVFLEVRESNAAARSLYEKAGFQQVGRRNQYYSHPAEDALLYRRSPV